MNTLICIIVSFSLGIIFAIAFLGCPLHAYDYENPRFGDTYFDRMEQKQRTDNLEQRQRQQEWRRDRPCP